ncbi:MAG: DNA polymerase III subunit chi [Hyphomicrobiaceae bacterium]
MTEVWFYHLERLPLDRVLPNLLERTLERGWRAVVQVGSDERLQALDTLLWTFSEESFLPHGSHKDGDVERQPVYLTSGAENPNASNIRFLVDGADHQDLGDYERAIYIFDGHDDEAVAAARDNWKAARDAGHEVTYWQQSEQGRWEKKA